MAASSMRPVPVSTALMGMCDQVVRSSSRRSPCAHFSCCQSSLLPLPATQPFANQVRRRAAVSAFRCLSCIHRKAVAAARRWIAGCQLCLGVVWRRNGLYRLHSMSITGTTLAGVIALPVRAGRNDNMNGSDKAACVVHSPRKWCSTAAMCRPIRISVCVAPWLGPRWRQSVLRCSFERWVQILTWRCRCKRSARRNRARSTSLCMRTASVHRFRRARIKAFCCAMMR